MKNMTLPQDIDFEDFDFDEGIDQRRQGRKLSSVEIQGISEYLENPTHAGVWQLVFALPEDAPICNTIIKELDKKLKGKPTVEIIAGKRKMKLKLNAKKRQEWDMHVKQKLSFFNSLFLRLHQSTRAQVDTLEGLFTDDTYEAILQVLEVPQLRKSLGAAVDIFSKNIMHKNFIPIVSQRAVFLTKNSFMLLGGVKDDVREFTFLSCGKTGLQEYAEFLKTAGRITDYKLMPIYSPEEQVFAPYFAFLRAAAPSVIKDAHVKKPFEKAFGEYEGKNYSNCIGTIGLIAEDYLTQILETFFREVSPKGLTLGQLYEHVLLKIATKFAKPEKNPKDLTVLYKEITVALEDAKSNPRHRKDKECFELIRKVLNIIKDDRELFERRMDKVKDSPKRISIFPLELRDNMTDLIRFRNAVSHRTMIPIGSYEALRSVYCLMSLVMWWGKEKEAIQWESSPEAIICASILRNTGVTV